MEKYSAVKQTMDKSMKMQKMATIEMCTWWYFAVEKILHISRAISPMHPSTKLAKIRFLSCFV